MEWDNVFAIHVCDKGLNSKSCEKFDSKKASNLTGKQAKI